MMQRQRKEVSCQWDECTKSESFLPDMGLSSVLPPRKPCTYIIDTAIFILSSRSSLSTTTVCTLVGNVFPGGQRQVSVYRHPYWFELAADWQQEECTITPCWLLSAHWWSFNCSPWFSLNSLPMDFAFHFEDKPRRCCRNARGQVWHRPEWPHF